MGSLRLFAAVCGRMPQSAVVCGNAVFAAFFLREWDDLAGGDHVDDFAHTDVFFGGDFGGGEVVAMRAALDELRGGFIGFADVDGLRDAAFVAVGDLRFEDGDLGVVGKDFGDDPDGEDGRKVDRAFEGGGVDVSKADDFAAFSIFDAHGGGGVFAVRGKPAHRAGLQGHLAIQPVLPVPDSLT